MVHFCLLLCFDRYDFCMSKVFSFLSKRKRSGKRDLRRTNRTNTTATTSPKDVCFVESGRERKRAALRSSSSSSCAKHPAARAASQCDEAEQRNDEQRTSISLSLYFQFAPACTFACPLSVSGGFGLLSLPSALVSVCEVTRLELVIIWLAG